MAMSQVRLQLNGGEDMSDKQIQEGFDIGKCEAPLECAPAQGEGECGIKCWWRHGGRSISGTDFVKEVEDVMRERSVLARATV